MVRVVLVRVSAVDALLRRGRGFRSAPLRRKAFSSLSSSSSPSFLFRPLPPPPTITTTGAATTARNNHSAANNSSNSLLAGADDDDVRNNEFRRLLNEDDEFRSSLMYCLAFAQDSETDFVRNFERLFPPSTISTNRSSAIEDELRETRRLQQQQLEYSVGQLLRKTNKTRASPSFAVDTLPLPRTVREALRPQKNRAIVITETERPYRIVDVNQCWINLCGYSYTESKNQTLGSLLHGPQTNVVAATALITQLLASQQQQSQNNHDVDAVSAAIEEVGTIIINYKKDGTPFKNRIRVGPLYDDDNYNSNYDVRSDRNRSTPVPKYFVGVLQEIQ